MGDGGAIHWYVGNQKWNRLEQRTDVMNFVLILLGVKYLLGTQVDILSKKLDVWFWASGEKGEWYT